MVSFQSTALSKWGRGGVVVVVSSSLVTSTFVAGGLMKTTWRKSDYEFLRSGLTWRGSKSYSFSALKLER